VTDARGITIHPDFTVELSNTVITVNCEHLGMMTREDYIKK